VKRNIYDICIFYTLNIVFACTSFAAAPEINSVVGIIRSGSVMNISGRYLMDENKANWLLPFTSGSANGFQGFSYEADGYYLAPDEMIHGTRGYDRNVKLSGIKSIYGNVRAATKTGAGFGVELPSPRTEIYSRMYSRWNSSGTWKWPDICIKNHPPMGNIGDSMYSQPNYGTSSALPAQMKMVYDGLPHDYSVNNFLRNNRWYCIEVRNKTFSPTN
jgi:hypothetical protein